VSKEPEQETAVTIAGVTPEVPSNLPANLFDAPNPMVVIERATQVAKALADVLETQKLYTTISGRNHVRVEGWTLCGSMLGVFPVCMWTRPVEQGWEARVEARTMNGNIVGAAEAQCTAKESKWKGRDDFAIRSMAQTRATSKAMRLPLGFIIQLAGYEATPAEEMDGVTRFAADQEPTSPTIGGGEVNYLAELIADTDTDLSKLLAFFNVPSLDFLTAAQYNKAVSMLNAKKNKA
jgi:hypothetical protein